jgi:hypothetical protein
LVGAGRFAAAYLVKEGIVALERRDPGHLWNAVLGLQAPEFWGGLGLFSAVAQGASRLVASGMVTRALPSVARAAARSYLPMAAAIPALEVALGERDPATIARRTAVYVGVGAALDLPMMVAMVAVPGPGTLVGGAYFIGKLALMLWLGEKLDRAIEGFLTPEPKP